MYSRDVSPRTAQCSHPGLPKRQAAQANLCPSRLGPANLPSSAVHWVPLPIPKENICFCYDYESEKGRAKVPFYVIDEAILKMQKGGTGAIDALIDAIEDRIKVQLYSRPLRIRLRSRSFRHGRLNEVWIEIKSTTRRINQCSLFSPEILVHAEGKKRIIYKLDEVHMEKSRVLGANYDVKIAGVMMRTLVRVIKVQAGKISPLHAERHDVEGFTQFCRLNEQLNERHIYVVGRTQEIKKVNNVGSGDGQIDWDSDHSRSSGEKTDFLLSQESRRTHELSRNALIGRLRKE